MPTVAIVGAGLIGRAWAVVFARAGIDVRVFDPDAFRGRKSVRSVAPHL
jgi:L-gulonate 3-dehydrogenase